MKKSFTVRFLNAVVLLALIGLTACAAQPTPITPTPTPTVPPQPDIASTSWLVVSYIDNDGALHEPALENTPTLIFQDGQVSGFSGCNTFEGTYQREGGSLYLNLTSMTETACSAVEATFQEQNYMDALVTVASYQLDGGQLKLVSPFGKVMLVLEPSP